MQFSLTAIALAFATLAAAMPHESGLESQGDVRWKVPKGMTVKEAQSKCGDQAQLSCCNKAVYAGDTTDVNSGIGGGLLSNLIGTGSGASGAGIFDQCSKLDVQSEYPSIPMTLASILISLSSHFDRCPHPGPARSALQAEHCLLCRFSFHRQQRPRWRWASLRCPRLHPVSVVLRSLGFLGVASVL